MSNFKYLQDLINEKASEVVLECDITYSIGEESIKIRKDDFVIDGKGHFIDGFELTKIFDIEGSDITLKNMIIKNSKGAVISHCKGLKIINCEFSNNKSKSGAAILNYDSLEIYDSKFVGNESFRDGGAVMNIDSELKIENCEFVKNKSGEGGAVKHFSLLGGGGLGFVLGKLPRLRIFNSSFRENESSNHFGAISAWGVLAVENCEFIKNTAVKNGGAIGINRTGNALISKSTFRHNNASVAGALINFATLMIQDCEFEYNNGDWAAGALCNEFETYVEIRGTRFVNNYSIVGGAICSAGSMDIWQSEFTNNTAKENGSAIDCEERKMSIKKTQFTGNHSGDGSVISTKSLESLLLEESNLPKKDIKELEPDA